MFFRIRYAGEDIALVTFSPDYSTNDHTVHEPCCTPEWTCNAASHGYGRGQGTKRYTNVTVQSLVPQLIKHFKAEKEKKTHNADMKVRLKTEADTRNTWYSETNKLFKMTPEINYSKNISSLVHDYHEVECEADMDTWKSTIELKKCHRKNITEGVDLEIKLSGIDSDIALEIHQLIQNRLRSQTIKRKVAKATAEKE